MTDDQVRVVGAVVVMACHLMSLHDVLDADACYLRDMYEWWGADFCCAFPFHKHSSAKHVVSCESDAQKKETVPLEAFVYGWTLPPCSLLALLLCISQ